MPSGDDVILIFTVTFHSVSGCNISCFAPNKGKSKEQEANEQAMKFFYAIVIQYALSDIDFFDI